MWKEAMPILEKDKVSFKSGNFSKWFGGGGVMSSDLRMLFNLAKACRKFHFHLWPGDHSFLN